MNRWIRRLGVAALVVLALLALGLVALMRPDIPYAQLQRKYGAPADAYMTLPGHLLVRYHDEGRRTAPVLVLVHGFSASLTDWDAWADRLSGRYRVIRLDLPGHGLTRAPAGYRPSTDDYADIVDALTARLDAPRFVLAGNSMGGGVAWNFALRHPGRLDGLVLVDAAGWPRRSAQKGAPVIFSLMRNPLAGALLERIDARPLIGQGLRSAFLDPALVTPAVIDRYAEFARAPGHRAVLMAIQGRSRAGVTAADLGRIAVPTLVMYGEQDRLIPFADGQAFAREIPGATLIGYPGVGHVPMEQIPGRSAADLDRWLQARVYPPAPGSTASTE
jgi:pimeloyl-ACP methyl ester carboxylesterase